MMTMKKVTMKQGFPRESVEEILKMSIKTIKLLQECGLAQ
jgi:hypothetical protein